jgi:AcrR family transcriptional regulator
MTTVTLREKKRRDTRARLSQTALSLFERKGVEGVTIEEIAAAADVGKGTVYNYYRSKEDILVEFLHRIELGVLPSIAGMRIGARPLAQILNQAAWSLLESKAEHYAYVRVVLARIVSGDAEFLARMQAFQSAIQEAFARLFERLLAQGRIARKWEAHDLSLHFTVLHLGLSAFWALEGPPFAAAKRLSKGETEIFAGGIAP